MTLYQLCDEPGCERPLGHGGLHFRTEVDGFSEWGDIPELAELVASVARSLPGKSTDEGTSGDE